MQIKTLATDARNTNKNIKNKVFAVPIKENQSAIKKNSPAKCIYSSVKFVKKEL